MVKNIGLELESLDDENRMVRHQCVTPASRVPLVAKLRLLRYIA